MTTLRPEPAAQGILKTGSYGDAMFYYVACTCGDSDCSHSVEVEADESGVHVHVYTIQHTKWWQASRWSQIWEILTKGHATMQSTVVLDRQTAVNYAASLMSAVSDVEQFRSNRK